MNKPRTPENRAGLPQLAYRITDYTSSRKRLVELLRDSLRQGDQPGPLFKLTTRGSDDTAIALLDAWSVLADVLTFYQERIANEGYLRTATERRSVLELARTIGYELNPGVAASTYFAFTLEDAPGSPDVTPVPKGTQIVSIPEEDELPQTFETSEDFLARVEWNNLKPRASRPQQINSTTRQLYIKGINTLLQPGDLILLIDDVPNGSQHLLRLKSVGVNAQQDYTMVHWEVSYPGADKLLQNPQLFAFRQTAAPYGHNAPGTVEVVMESNEIKKIEWQKIQDWLNPKLQPENAADQIDLDALYPKILEKQWIALFDDQNSNSPKIDKIKSVSSESKVDNLLLIEKSQLAQTRQITRVTLNSAIDRSKFDIRRTIVLAQSESLELVQEPLTVGDRQMDIFQDPIRNNTVFLNEFVQKRYRNQTLIVSGQHPRALLNEIGGVAVLSKNDKAYSVERKTKGLTNTQVRSLAFYSKGLLAGTTEGLFRSNDNGELWEPIVEWESASENIETKDIQALRSHNSSIFVGTASGLFASKDGGKSWETKVGLSYTDIRVIYSDLNRQLLVGTLNGGLFRSVDDGKNWRATGLNNTDVHSLTRYPKNNSTLTFAGTIQDGIFRCTDSEFLIWQQITDIRQATGTITTEGTSATGQGTTFSTQLQPGDVINAAEQSRTVLEITSEFDSERKLKLDRLILDRPFRPDLTTSTTFTINTGLTNRNITTLESNDHYVFAGTAGSGVFRSSPEETRTVGDRWTAINTGLTDLEIRCLAIDGDVLWAGTSKDGLFRSTNNGESWEAVKPNVTNLDIRAILPAPPRQTSAALPNSEHHLLVGGIGILQPPEGSYPKPVQRGDILEVLEPPAPILTQENALLWKLMDKDGFQGDFTMTEALVSTVMLLPALTDSARVSEIAIIENPPTGQQRPILTLQQSLRYAYDPVTVRIYANVVLGTHGATIGEVLGSGDGHQPNQRFVLKKPPLTYVPASNARGSDSTLAVRVNGVLWKEAASLYPLKPTDQHYIVRIEDDGTTQITFGDGTKGARLPSGMENITALYRTGIGLEGNLKADQLSLLKTRPLGVSEVTNPLPATGGAPPESMSEAKSNAPATVRTLDRIVSIRDFEDFAQGFSGIGKAQALPLWNGETQQVHITVAGVQGSEVVKDSNLYTKLVEAIDNARDPIQQVQVDSYERLLFNLEARLLLDLRYEAKVVATAIRQTLTHFFAFEKRKFGQAVTASEVIGAIQSVEGVIAVDLDALYQVGRSKALARSLPALLARYDAQTRMIYPAQLWRLNPEGTQLTIVSTL
ncbi:putative baseplate assembly protein [Leptolyngbya sp. FACHB-17]|uniref:putative baseplate assembly protein n=1 Tax=unclassified Leptolyngbya TaxID=2650499 RepID=UPI0016812551|nr:putative baseplate assembly protein [Leptolyngbya sp. FACHB-17]MBD2080944.1 putative baseplate assembly protein [Leptolyngbya sp. FACHB-17]